MSEINIDTLPTPNPNALMFKLSAPVVEAGTWEFPDRASAVGSPLPNLIFGLDGVQQVLVTYRYVTINKSNDYGWPELVPAIKGLIREHIDSGEPAVTRSTAEAPPQDNSELAVQIRAVLEEKIRPALNMDGGDVEFIGVTSENVLQVRLVGSCSSCPSSTMTLAMGIERTIMENFPEIMGVEQI
jgi:Fe-S cluster biogenesis protein NfuA